jgi:hypothetical protein
MTNAALKSTGQEVEPHIRPTGCQTAPKSPPKFEVPEDFTPIFDMLVWPGG